MERGQPPQLGEETDCANASAKGSDERDRNSSGHRPASATTREEVDLSDGRGKPPEIDVRLEDLVHPTNG